MSVGDQSSGSASLKNLTNSNFLAFFSSTVKSSPKIHAFGKKSITF